MTRTKRDSIQRRGLTYIQITLTGIRMQVVQAKTEILEVERASSTIFKAPPTSWTPQKEEMEIVEIVRGTDEWQTIEKRMAETMATVSISPSHTNSFLFIICSLTSWRNQKSSANAELVTMGEILFPKGSDCEKKPKYCRGELVISWYP